MLNSAKSSLCIPIVGPAMDDAALQIDAALKLADCIELRLDLFHDIEISKIRKLREKISIPLIFTLRKKSEGGGFEGNENERITRLLELIHLKPDYIDVEWDVSDLMIASLRKANSDIKILISYHNFEETPKLDAIWKKIYRKQGDAYKLVTTAHSVLDHLEMLRFISDLDSMLLVSGMCMQSDGSLSRILAPIAKNSLVFACLSENQASARGQMHADVLLNHYRFRSLNSKTFLLGLIGDPVDKSMSHQSHNRVLHELDLPGIYAKFRVKDEELSSFFEIIKSFNIKGLSVTMPLKEKVIPFLDQIDPLAKGMEAVNTIHFTPEGLKGYNTDGIGALKAIGAKISGDWSEKFQSRRILMIGAGGTAKAIAYVAHRLGAQVTILNRHINRALAIANKIGCHADSLDQLDKYVRSGYDILIHATSVGMGLESEACLLGPQHFIPGSIVLDVISNPKQTCLLKEAKNQGCMTVSGMEMFIQQAIAQFKIWLPGVESYNVEESIRKSLLD